MKSGLKPTRPDHRDYDFLKSHGFGATFAQLPPEYSVENGLWVPNQNDAEPVFTNPPLPFGCTDYTQADICADEDGKLYNPAEIEAITHANAEMGGDIRAALKAIQGLWGRTAYFNIRSSGVIDAFDSVRLALYSSQPEKRSVSVGTPWYSAFEQTLGGIVSTPQDYKDIGSWHNHKICGWKTINGTPYLISKSWQGNIFGDKGFCYFPRDVFNAIMSISGSAAFTTSKVAPAQILTVDLSIVDTIVSYIRWLLKL